LFTCRIKRLNGIDFQLCINISYFTISYFTMSRKKRVTITKEMKEIIVNMAFSEKKSSVDNIACTLNVSKSAVRNILNKQQEGTDFVAAVDKRKATCIARNSIYSDAENVLYNAVACDNAMIQSEMANKVFETTGVTLSQPTVSRKLKKMKISRKRLVLVPEERNSEQNIGRRAIYARRIGRLSPKKLVFLDESGFNKHLRRRYGYSNFNEKAYITVPGNRGINKSLICAINVNGTIGYEFKTGAYNSASLERFITTHLGPYFAQHPDHLLIMDNVPFHKSRAITNVLCQLGITTEYLPPWSPQLNPIEEFFAMVKSKFRALQNENSGISIDDALNQILRTDNDYSEECLGFWRSMERWLDLARQKSIFI